MNPVRTVSGFGWCNNLLSPALRSGHRLSQRPSPEKQFPGINQNNSRHHHMKLTKWLTALIAAVMSQEIRTF